MAARRGRGDLLELFERRGVSLPLAGVDELIAACARNDAAAVAAIRQREPAPRRRVAGHGRQAARRVRGQRQHRAASAHLLDLGVSPGRVFERW